MTEVTLLNDKGKVLAVGDFTSIDFQESRSNSLTLPATRTIKRNKHDWINSFKNMFKGEFRLPAKERTVRNIINVAGYKTTIITLQGTLENNEDFYSYLSKDTNNEQYTLSCNGLSMNDLSLHVINCAGYDRYSSLEISFISISAKKNK